MEEITCEICGKKIEGYSKNHVKYLMAQHMLTHKYTNEYLKNEQKEDR